MSSRQQHAATAGQESIACPWCTHAFVVDGNVRLTRNTSCPECRGIICVPARPKVSKRKSAPHRAPEYRSDPRQTMILGKTP